MILDEYVLTKFLGKGTFGEVYLTKKNDSDCLYATKKMPKEFVEDQRYFKYFNNEISILKKLFHKNIIRFIGMKKTLNHYYLIMEYCNGGTLTENLEKYQKIYHRPFTEEIVQHIMRQIVNAINYIHGLGIIHRDLKLDNILVQYNSDKDKNELNILKSEMKIIDFGFAAVKDKTGLLKTAVGSPIYMDPLILKKFNSGGTVNKELGYDEKADIWSLGTLCYQMLLGSSAFEAFNIEELVTKIEEGTYRIPTSLSREVVSFLNAMLQYNSQKRLSASKLIQHAFLIKDIKDFTPIDINSVSKKVYGGQMNINIKENKTIWSIFNEEDEKKLCNIPGEIFPTETPISQSQYLDVKNINVEKGEHIITREPIDSDKKYMEREFTIAESTPISDVALETSNSTPIPELSNITSNESEKLNNFEEINKQDYKTPMKQSAFPPPIFQIYNNSPFNLRVPNTPNYTHNRIQIDGKNNNIFNTYENGQIKIEKEKIFPEEIMHSNTNINVQNLQTKQINPQNYMKDEMQTNKLQLPQMDNLQVGPTDNQINHIQPNLINHNGIQLEKNSPFQIQNNKMQINQIQNNQNLIMNNNQIQNNEIQYIHQINNNLIKNLNNNVQNNQIQNSPQINKSPYNMFTNIPRIQINQLLNNQNLYNQPLQDNFQNNNIPKNRNLSPNNHIQLKNNQNQIHNQIKNISPNKQIKINNINNPLPHQNQFQNNITPNNQIIQNQFQNKQLPNNQHPNNQIKNINPNYNIQNNQYLNNNQIQKNIMQNNIQLKNNNVIQNNQKTNIQGINNQNRVNEIQNNQLLANQYQTNRITTHHISPGKIQPNQLQMNPIDMKTHQIKQFQINNPMPNPGSLPGSPPRTPRQVKIIKIQKKVQNPQIEMNRIIDMQKKAMTFGQNQNMQIPQLIKINTPRKMGGQSPMGQVPFQRNNLLTQNKAINHPMDNQKNLRQIKEETHPQPDIFTNIVPNQIKKIMMPGKKRSNSEGNALFFLRDTNNDNTHHRMIIGPNSPDYGQRMPQNNFNNKKINNNQIIINGVQKNMISPEANRPGICFAFRPNNY